MKARGERECLAIGIDRICFYACICLYLLLHAYACLCACCPPCALTHACLRCMHPDARCCNMQQYVIAEVLTVCEAAKLPAKLCFARRCCKMIVPRRAGDLQVTRHDKARVCCCQKRCCCQIVTVCLAVVTTELPQLCRNAPALRPGA